MTRNRFLAAVALFLAAPAEALAHHRPGHSKGGSTSPPPDASGRFPTNLLVPMNALLPTAVT